MQRGNFFQGKPREKCEKKSFILYCVDAWHSRKKVFYCRFFRVVANLSDNKNERVVFTFYTIYSFHQFYEVFAIEKFVKSRVVCVL